MLHSITQQHFYERFAGLSLFSPVSPGLKVGYRDPEAGRLGKTVSEKSKFVTIECVKSLSIRTTENVLSQDVVR